MTGIVEILRFYDRPLTDLAADEIERLRGVVESWKHSYKLLDERREQVEAERDAAVADAERYRWLRNSDDDVPYQLVMMYVGAKLDAAIDSARKEGA